MRIEPEHVRAIVAKLNEWDIEVSEMTCDDLVAEFDTRIQKNLEGGGSFRKNDLDTSKMAARMHQTHSRTYVLMAFIRAAEHGLTNDELYETVDPDGTRDRDSWVPRVGELKRMGFVTTTSRKRFGKKKVKQQVHVVTNEGIAFARQKGWRA